MGNSTGFSNFNHFHYNLPGETKDFTPDEYNEEFQKIANKPQKEYLICDHHTFKTVGLINYILHRIKGWFNSEIQAAPVKVNYEILKLLKYGQDHEYLKETTIQQLLEKVQATLNRDKDYKETVDVIKDLFKSVASAKATPNLERNLQNYYFRHQSELSESFLSKLFRNHEDAIAQTNTQRQADQNFNEIPLDDDQEHQQLQAPAQEPRAQVDVSPSSEARPNLHATVPDQLAEQDVIVVPQAHQAPAQEPQPQVDVSPSSEARPNLNATVPDQSEEQDVIVVPQAHQAPAQEPQPQVDESPVSEARPNLHVTVPDQFEEQDVIEVPQAHQAPEQEPQPRVDEQAPLQEPLQPQEQAGEAPEAVDVEPELPAAAPPKTDYNKVLNDFKLLLNNATEDEQKIKLVKELIQKCNEIPRDGNKKLIVQGYDLAAINITLSHDKNIDIAEEIVAGYLSVDGLEDAESLLEGMIEVDAPKSNEYEAQLAEIKIRLGKEDEASIPEEQNEPALPAQSPAIEAQDSLPPPAAELSTKTEVDEFLTQADVEFKKGNYVSMLDHYKHAFEKASNDQEKTKIIEDLVLICKNIPTNDYKEIIVKGYDLAAYHLTLSKDNHIAIAEEIAEGYQSAGSLKDAESYWEELVEISPPKVNNYRIKLAEIKTRLNKDDEALELYEQVVAEAEKADSIEMLSKALKAFPKDPLINYELGKLYQVQNQLDKAQRHLQDSIKDKKGIHLQKAHALLGKILFNNKHYQNALNNFIQADKYSKDTVADDLYNQEIEDCYTWLATDALEKADYKQVVKCINNALKLNLPPATKEKLATNLLNIFYKDILPNDTAAAIACCQLLTNKLGDKDLVAEAHLKLADMLADQDLQACITCLENARDISSEQYKENILAKLAECYTAVPNFDLAEQMYLQLIGEFSENGSTYHALLANIYSRLNRIDQALSHYKEAYALCADETQKLKIAGQVLSFGCQCFENFSDTSIDAFKTIISSLPLLSQDPTRNLQDLVIAYVTNARNTPQHNQEEILTYFNEAAALYQSMKNGDVTPEGSEQNAVWANEWNAEWLAEFGDNLMASKNLKNYHNAIWYYQQALELVPNEKNYQNKLAAARNSEDEILLERETAKAWELSTRPPIHDTDAKTALNELIKLLNDSSIKREIGDALNNRSVLSLALFNSTDYEELQSTIALASRANGLSQIKKIEESLAKLLKIAGDKNRRYPPKPETLNALTRAQKSLNLNIGLLEEYQQLLQKTTNDLVENVKNSDFNQIYAAYPNLTNDLTNNDNAIYNAKLAFTVLTEATRGKNRIQLPLKISKQLHLFQQLLMPSAWKAEAARIYSNLCDRFVSEGRTLPPNFQNQCNSLILILTELGEYQLAIDNYLYFKTKFIPGLLTIPDDAFQAIGGQYFDKGLVNLNGPKAAFNKLEGILVKPDVFQEISKALDDTWFGQHLWNSDDNKALQEAIDSGKTVLTISQMEVIANTLNILINKAAANAKAKPKPATLESLKNALQNYQIQISALKEYHLLLHPEVQKLATIIQNEGISAVFKGWTSIEKDIQDYNKAISSSGELLKRISNYKPSNADPKPSLEIENQITILNKLMSPSAWKYKAIPYLRELCDYYSEETEELSPNVPTYCNQLIESYKETGSPSEAIKIYELFMDRIPAAELKKPESAYLEVSKGTFKESHPVPNQQNYERLMQDAEGFKSKQAYSQAVEKYKQAINEAPYKEIATIANKLKQIGDGLLNQKNYNDSLNTYDLTINYYLKCLPYIMGTPTGDSASKALMDLINKLTTAPWPQDKLESALMLALKSFEAARTSAGPLFLKANPVLILSTMATTALRIKDQKKSIAYYSQALRYEPKNAGLLVRLGDAYLADKNHDAAIESFSKALRAAPDNLAIKKRLFDISITAGDIHFDNGMAVKNRDKLNAAAVDTRKKLINLHQFLLLKSSTTNSSYFEDIRSSLGAITSRFYDNTDNANFKNYLSKPSKNPSELIKEGNDVIRLLNMAYDGKTRHKQPDEMPPEIKRYIEILITQLSDLQSLQKELPSVIETKESSEKLFHKATSQYQRAAKLGNLDSAHYNKLIEALVEEKQYKEAKATFSEIQEMVPSMRNSLKLPSKVFLDQAEKLKKPKDEEFLLKCIEENPKNISFKQALSKLYISTASEKENVLKDYKRAYEYYQKAIKTMAPSAPIPECEEGLADLYCTAYKAKQSVNRDLEFKTESKQSVHSYQELALHHYLEALSENPASAELNAKIGILLSEMPTSYLEKKAESSGSEDLKNPPAFLRLATALEPDNKKIAGQLEEALAQFEKE